jgi:hypothetical protein
MYVIVIGARKDSAHSCLAYLRIYIQQVATTAKKLFVA